MPYWSDETGKFTFEQLFAADALLLGRSTYQCFAEARPSKTDEPGFADRMNSLPKYVVSSTSTERTWNNSRLITGEFSEEVAKLKQRPGQDILLAGSATLADALVRHDLVDEYRLLIYPVVVGGGKRRFKDRIDMKTLQLAASRMLGPGSSR